MAIDYLVDLYIDGRLILKSTIKGQWEGVGWIYMIQEREDLWFIVNAVMNVRFL